MAKLRIRIHPLFFVLGLFYALTGKIFFFLIVTLTAVLHEFAHAARAARLGYRLDAISLMPYGAVIGGDLEGLRLRDEISVAFAGPALNLALALGTMGLWWAFPDLYAYTDSVAAANLSLAAVNLLPAYPLDGGRIFLAALSLRLKRKTALAVSRAVSTAFAALLLAAFVRSCFFAVDLTLLFFAVFLLVGVWGAREENKYVRLSLSSSAKELARGKRIYRFAVSERVTLKRFLALLDPEAINEAVIVFDDGRECPLGREEVQKLVETGELYRPIGKTYRSLLQKSRICDTIKG